MTAIVIIAHAPLAGAFEDLLKHVYSDLQNVYAFNIHADECRHSACRRITHLLLNSDNQNFLFLNDLIGATPANITKDCVTVLREQHRNAQAVFGLNACMLISSYANRQLDPIALSQKALNGANKGLQLLVTESA
ncbi:PTS sugar transporter subunit IIA [Brackiella oedipodis]|uniref:PTS sugar transporter subunit IIA n=1 Tax=Brackiella oedipodis TaxID=124225 RepID=UPI00048A5C7F|nr:hypothetical protein [Brackiella oedipodis]